jgi:hypothetical protein
MNTQRRDQGEAPPKYPTEPIKVPVLPGYVNKEPKLRQK